MKPSDKIYVAGHSGLVGSAICRNLQEKGYKHILTRSHGELDLIDPKGVAEFFEINKPDYVFLAAAKVGGIVANNTYRAEFIRENLCVQNNVIHESFVHGVKKLLFLGSTCIYPRDCPQPMKEEYLLTSPLEYTNEPYAISKIAGIKMCESYNLQYGTNFISVMPTNLYGPGDNFDLEKAHVLPALVRKMHLAKLLEQNRWGDVKANLEVKSKEDALKILETFNVSNEKVEIWGSGNPKREFMWSPDMADACVFLMEHVDFSDLAKDMKEVRNTHINIGTGQEISIGELAKKIKRLVGFTGDLVFNVSKPDGTLRKLTDVTRLHDMGWYHRTGLDKGLEAYYQWYIQQDQSHATH